MLTGIIGSPAEPKALRFLLHLKKDRVFVGPLRTLLTLPPLY